VSRGTGLADKASELRAVFERSFAEAPHRDTTVRHDFLAVRIGADPYAIRLSEIGGLFTDKKITPVPGRTSTLLGIAGFRGAILPVHDLRTLFGYGTGDTPRWLVVAAKLPVALAFNAFEGHLRLAPDAITPHDRRDESRAYVGEVARAPDHARPIVDIPAVLDAIKTQVRQQAVEQGSLT
jgi:chemotaxis signal transduction protein